MKLNPFVHPMPSLVAQVLLGIAYTMVVKLPGEPAGKAMLGLGIILLWGLLDWAFKPRLVLLWAVSILSSAFLLWWLMAPLMNSAAATVVAVSTSFGRAGMCMTVWSRKSKPEKEGRTP